MLRTLSLRDFVIVDTLELEFSAGFSVLTGETGAGKSILIDALTLLLGGRGDAGVVREGAAKADLSAEFAVGGPAQQWLADQQLANEEDSALLRRVIDTAGRSKAYINGVAATTAQLRELGELLVDIHGQHAHQSLLKSEAQRTLLDTQAGMQETARALAKEYKAWQALARQRADFEADAQQLLLERERLEWQLAELEKLALKPGEWEEVTAEHSRLSHAASLIEGAQETVAALSESDQPILSKLFSLHQKMTRLADIDAALKPVLECLEPARIQLQEAVYSLNDYLSRAELDPARLAHVEARMEVLHGAARKFRVAPEALPQAWQELAAQCRQLADASDPEALQRQEDAARESYLQAARQLSAARMAAAQKLGQAISAAMQELSMAGGRFAVALLAGEPASYGLEQVEFMVAGHAGSVLRPLAKVASGGELARIALAISVITSSATLTPTLIFDEVDSGIGGGVAEVVGRLLKRLGQQRQVLCVTHLAQVASQASEHFQVSKATQADGNTVSRIELLDQKNRVEEIARMLGGLEITATTRQHARELLGE